MQRTVKNYVYHRKREMGRMFEQNSLRNKISTFIPFNDFYSHLREFKLFHPEVEREFIFKISIKEFDLLMSVEYGVDTPTVVRIL